MNIRPFDTTLKFFLLTSPVCYMRGLSLNNFDVKYFHIGVMSLFFAALFTNPVRSLELKWILPSLFAVCMFNVMCHSMDSRALNSTLNIFLMVLTIVLIGSYVRSPEQFLFPIVTAGLVNVGVFVFQKYGFNPILSTTHPDFPGGIMGNTPRFATYLAVILPVMMRVSIWLFVLCVGISLIGFTLPQTAILGVAVMLLFFRSKTLKTRFLVAASFVGPAIIFYREILESFSVRLEIWKFILHRFFESPLIGMKLGYIPEYYKDTANMDLVIHSSIIHFVTGAGILGGVWLGIVLWKFFKRFEPSWESLAVLGVILLSFVEYPMEIKRLWLTIACLIGFYLIKESERCLPNRK